MKKDEDGLWDAFFACGLYLYLKETGELDEEKLWHETPEETERHWQQFQQHLKDKGMWREEQYIKYTNLHEEYQQICQIFDTA